MKTKVLYTPRQKRKILKGMMEAHRVVAATMGAAGKNAAYRSDYSNRPVVTNDGITIAKRINLEDEIQQFGVEFMIQPAERTNEEVGDATSTSIALSFPMCEKGMKMVEDRKFLGFTWKKGKNAMTLRRQMLASAERISEELKRRAIPVETDEQMFDIANLSMENPTVAKIIVDSVKKVGENGIVLVEESSGVSIVREDTDGFKFDKGFITPFCATDLSTMEAIVTDVHVLVTDKNLTMNNDVFPMIEALSKAGIKKLVIVCGGMGGEMLATVIANRRNGNFYTLVVEKPHDEEMLEDIAILTGAKSILNATISGGISSGHYAYLGKAAKVVSTPTSTLIMGAEGDEDQKKRIEDRISVIKKEIEETDSPYKKERLKERLAKLNGGIVTLKIGAPTEADMKYLKLKVDDAVAATRAAKKEGIVIGGGKTLYEIAQEPAIDDGDAIVKYACTQPMKHIMDNAGFTGNVTGKEVYNALTDKVTNDPMSEGIIDPVMAERCALKNAVSSAAIFITTDSFFVDVPEKNDRAVV